MPLLLDAVGGALDDMGERTIVSRMAGIPYAGNPPARRANGDLLQCEADALPYHARDRRITLYDTEPETSQRFRLSRWRQLHARRGTHRGALEHLQPYFLGVDGLGVLPRIRIVHQDGAGQGAMWHTLHGTLDEQLGLGAVSSYVIHREVPTNWDFDGQTSKWSRHWAIIYLSGTSFANVAHWDTDSPPATWDGGAIWDGIRGAILTDWISMLRDWGAAHSQLAGVILARNLTDLNPMGLASVSGEGWSTLPVGNWGKLVDPTTGKPTRDPSLSWIYDLYFS